MNHEKELQILTYLRQDSRRQLMDISRKTGIPVSTVFEKLKSLHGKYISRFTCLLNYEELGYSARVKMILKVKKEDKESLSDFLRKKHNINSVFRINNGYDFLVEGIFRNLQAVEHFTEEMESRFSIKKREVFYIMDNLKEEDFLSNSLLLCPAGR